MTKDVKVKNIVKKVKASLKSCRFVSKITETSCGNSRTCCLLLEIICFMLILWNLMTAGSLKREDDIHLEGLSKDKL